MAHFSITPLQACDDSAAELSDPQRRLELALRHGSPKAVRQALADGADPRQPSLVGETPLGACLRRGDTHLHDILVRAGASMARELSSVKGVFRAKLNIEPGVERRLGELSDYRDPEALRLLCAAAAGDAFSIRAIGGRKELSSVRSVCGSPALHWAIVSGHAHAVGALLGLGADPLAIGPDGFDAVELAAHSGRPAPLEALLSRGLSPSPREGRLSPLELALRGPIPSRPQGGVAHNLRPRVTRASREECARALLAAGASPRASLCQEPLRHALRLRSLPLVQELLSRGADPDEPISGLAPGLFLFRQPNDSHPLSDELATLLLALLDAGSDPGMPSPSAQQAHIARSNMPPDALALLEARALHASIGLGPAPHGASPRL